MARTTFATAVLLICATASAQAASTLFTQQPTPRNSATPFEVSATLWPDGLDSDYRVWDNFLLSGNATVTGVRWLGQGPGGLDAQSSFDIAFYTDISSIPYNIDVLHYTLASVLQPDVGAGPLKTTTVGTGAFTVAPDPVRADTWDYSLNFSAGQVLPLQGQRSYWITIQAHQTNGNGWSMATALGDGRSFIRGPAFYAGDVSYFKGTRDVAFSLVGTVAAAVPESGTGALLAAGLGALALTRRRRAAP